MKLTELKKLIKETIQEEQDYNKLFVHMLDKTHKSLGDMSDMEKKHFFNAVDKAYKAKSEGRLRGYNEAELTAGQKQLDVDKDGEIEGSDLAALRTQNEADNNMIYFVTLNASTGKYEVGQASKNASKTQTGTTRYKDRTLAQKEAEKRNTAKKNELTDKQKQLDVDKDGEIEGSDLAKLRNKNEVGTNDWHFKAIMKMYDMAGSFGKKKISVAATGTTNASKRDIERELRDTDYNEISDISDKLGLKETKGAQKKK